MHTPSISLKPVMNEERACSMRPRNYPLISLPKMGWNRIKPQLFPCVICFFGVAYWLKCLGNWLPIHIIVMYSLPMQNTCGFNKGMQTNSLESAILALVYAWHLYMGTLVYIYSGIYIYSWYILYILKHLTVQPIESNDFYQGTHTTTQTTNIECILCNYST